MLPVDAVLLLLLIAVAPLASALTVLAWSVRKLARWQGWIPMDRRGWAERRWVIWPSGGFLLAYAISFSYGLLIEAHWVELTRTPIPVDRPILGYERFRIIHLSDLHLEDYGSRERRVAELVAEAQPHLILLTGDYMNVRGGGKPLVDLLSRFESPFGTFGVAGNWDTKWVTRELFRSAGATLLEDETRLLEREGHRLRLVGHGPYPNRPLRELLEGLDDDAYTIYLQHSPDAAEDLAQRAPEQRVDLFLCGHTHGGQVCLPFWGAVVTMSKFHKKYERGLYEAQGVPMYVNRGVGMTGGVVPRVRFLSRPEVALIELRRAPRGQEDQEGIPEEP